MDVPGIVRPSLQPHGGLTFWGIDRHMCNVRTARLTALNVVSPLSGNSTTNFHCVGFPVETWRTSRRSATAAGEHSYDAGPLEL